MFSSELRCLRDLSQPEMIHDNNEIASYAYVSSIFFFITRMKLPSSKYSKLCYEVQYAFTYRLSLATSLVPHVPCPNQLSHSLNNPSEPNHTTLKANGSKTHVLP